ncbi:hypothetical protein ACF1A9_09250 [Streptomyces sp. NPDC014872]|uniref:hypothetical protein n=1 Tax=Streptomyces sp. NPDC014872 TaxID=3364926 RepID=UPI0037007AFA
MPLSQPGLHRWRHPGDHHGNEPAPTTKLTLGSNPTTDITRISPPQVMAVSPSGTGTAGVPPPPRTPAQLLPDQERTTRMQHGETHAQLIAVPPGRTPGKE